MRRYALLALGLSAVLLATFFAVQALGLSFLDDPRPVIARLGAAAPLASVALLVTDVVLPLPSSLVMIANGAFFGVAGGTLVSTAGAVGAALLAFAIGRASAGFVARFTSEPERRAVGGLLSRWGAFAIVVTRPIPILAETSALLAGTTPMGWGRLLAGALAGSVPMSLAYAVAGARAREASTSLVFLGVLGGAGALWTLGLVWSRRG